MQKKSDAFRVLASSCWRNLRRRQRRHTPWYNPDAPFAQIRVRCGLLNAAVGERRDLIISSPVDGVVYTLRRTACVSAAVELFLPGVDPPARASRSYVLGVRFILYYVLGVIFRTTYWPSVIFRRVHGPGVIFRYSATPGVIFGQKGTLCDNF